MSGKRWDWSAELVPFEVERLVVAMGQAEIHRAQARLEGAPFGGDGDGDGDGAVARMLVFAGVGGQGPGQRGLGDDAAGTAGLPEPGRGRVVTGFEDREPVGLDA
jgi:hypothetical protein